MSLRILLSTQRLPVVGGHEAYVRMQATMLLRRGYSLVVSPAEDGRFEGIDPSLTDGITYLPFSDLKRILAGHGTWPGERPDVGLTHGGVDPIALGELGRALPMLHFVHSPGEYCPSGTRFLMRAMKPCTIRPGVVPCTLHGLRDGCFFNATGDPQSPRMAYHAFRKLDDIAKRVYPNASAIIAQGPFVAGELRTLLGAQHPASRRIRSLLPPVDVSPTDDEHATPTRRRGEKAEIVVCGRLQPIKGIDQAIEALSEVSTPTKLIIVGEGPYRAHLEALAAKAPERHEIEFCGWLDQKDLSEIYRRADLLVFPSRWPEPFGLVGIEALRFGTPVVAYDVGGVSDWLLRSEGGLLVRGGDPVALGRAVDDFLRNEERRNQHGAQGKQFVREHFGTDPYVDALRSLIDEAIEWHASPH